VHCLALVTKEVVDFGKHQTRDVAGACLIDDVAKELVVCRALDEVVDERTSVAD
jgi:hypothetical protein